MKLLEWGKIVVSWVNHQLAPTNLSIDVFDLSILKDGQICIYILDQLKWRSITGKNEVSDNMIFHPLVHAFFRENYPSYNLYSVRDNEKDFVLIMSVLLHWLCKEAVSSSQLHVLNPMNNLDSYKQNCIKQFIQDLEDKPQREITQESIHEAIIKIGYVVCCVGSDSELVSSPSSSPMRMFGSPEVMQECHQKVHLLESKVEVLSCENSDLMNEVEIFKKRSINLDSENKNLKRSIYSLEEKMRNLTYVEKQQTSVISSVGDRKKELLEEISSLKECIDSLRDELTEATNYNQEVTAKLTEAEVEKKLLAEQINELLSRNTTLEAEIADLDSQLREEKTLSEDLKVSNCSGGEFVADVTSSSGTSDCIMFPNHSPVKGVSLDLEIHVVDLQNRLEYQTQELEKEKGSVEEKEHQLVSLTKDFEHVKFQLVKSLNELSSSQQEAIKIESSFMELSSQNAVLEEKYKVAMVDLKSRSKDLCEKIKELELTRGVMEEQDMKLIVLTKEFEQTKCQLDECRSELGNKQQEAAELKSTCTELLSQQTELKEKYKGTEVDLASCRKELSEKIQELDITRGVMEEHDLKLIVLTKEFEQTKCQLDECRSEFGKTHQEATELKSTCTELLSLQTELKEKYKGTEAELASCRKELSEKIQELAAKRGIMEEQDGKFIVLTNEFEQTKCQLDECRSELGNTQQEAAELKAACTELLSQQTELKEKYKNTEVDLASCRKELSEKIQELEVTRGVMEKQDVKLVVLTKECEKTKCQLDECRSELGNTQQEAAELKSTCTELLSQQIELKEKYKGAEVDLASCTKELSEKIQELVVIRGVMEEQEVKLIVLTKECEQTKCQLDECQSELVSTQQEAAELKSTCSELLSQQTELEEKYKGIEVDLVSCRKELSEKIRELEVTKGVMEEKDVKLIDLTKEFEQTKCQLDECRSELGNTQEEATEFKSSCTELLSLQTELEEKYKGTEAELASCRNELSEKVDEMKIIESLAEKRQVLLEVSNKKYESLAKELRDCKFQLNDYKLEACLKEKEYNKLCSDFDKFTTTNNNYCIDLKTFKIYMDDEIKALNEILADNDLRNYSDHSQSEIKDQTSESSCTSQTADEFNVFVLTPEEIISIHTEKMDYLKNEFINFNSRRNKFSEESSRKEERIQSLESEVLDLSTRLSSLQQVSSQLASYRNEITQLQKDNIIKDREINALQKAATNLRTSQSDLATLDKENESLMSLLDEKEALLSKQKNDIDCLQKEMTQMKFTADNFKLALERLKSKSLSPKVDIINLEQDARCKDQKIMKLSDELEKVQEKFRKLHYDFDNYKKFQQDKLSIVESKNRALLADLATTRSKLSESESFLTCKNTIIEKLGNENDRLKCAKPHVDKYPSLMCRKLTDLIAAQVVPSRIQLSPSESGTNSMEDFGSLDSEDTACFKKLFGLIDSLLRSYKQLNSNYEKLVLSIKEPDKTAVKEKDKISGAPVKGYRVLNEEEVELDSAVHEISELRNKLDRKSLIISKLEQNIAMLEHEKLILGRRVGWIYNTNADSISLNFPSEGHNYSSSGSMSVTNSCHDFRAFVHPACSPSDRSVRSVDGLPHYAGCSSCGKHGIDNVACEDSCLDPWTPVLKNPRSQKKKISKIIPRFSFNSRRRIFPEADEAEESFNETCLADLKQGICHPVPPRKQLEHRAVRDEHPRLSLGGHSLQGLHSKKERNKDEHPVRLSLGGHSLQGLHSKKEKNKITYNKPGPPTPIKNSVRLSLQEQRDLFATKPLKEVDQNSEEHKKKIKSQETPGRKKSNFFKRTFGRENYSFK